MKKNVNVFLSIGNACLGDMISNHGFQYHLYSDDAQVYMSCSANITSCDLDVNIMGCPDAISDRMVKSQFKLNSEKTDIIAFSVKHNKNLSMHIGDVAIPMKSDVRDLGIVVTFKKLSSFSRVIHEIL